jgi:hypothetical protein
MIRIDNVLHAIVKSNLKSFRTPEPEKNAERLRSHCFPASEPDFPVISILPLRGYLQLHLCSYLFALIFSLEKAALAGPGLFYPVCLPV